MQIRRDRYTFRACMNHLTQSLKNISIDHITTEQLDGIAYEVHDLLTRSVQESIPQREAEEVFLQIETLIALLRSQEEQLRHRFRQDQPHGSYFTAHV